MPNTDVNTEQNSKDVQKEQSQADTSTQKTKRKKKKKVKVIYTDDGHTVYDMSGVGGEKKRAKDGDAALTRKEKRAAIFAGFAYYLPRFLLIVGCFCLAGLLLWLWLR